MKSAALFVSIAFVAFLAPAVSLFLAGKALIDHFVPKGISK